MVMAQLHGKMSEDSWVSGEDMLTGMVLGAIKNLDPSLTLSILDKAIPIEGTSTIEMNPPLEWTFWPSWDECEPDVIIEDEGNLCVIEAKLYADFGDGDAPERQLWREWRDGLRHAQKSNKRFWLLALTNHGSLPLDSILRQLESTDADLSRVFWLSWFEVGRAIRRASDEQVGGWRQDLLEVFSRMGIAPCDGFAEVIRDTMALSISDMPWVASRPLPLEILPKQGFADAIAMVRRLDLANSATWKLALGRRVESPGFEQVVAVTKEAFDRGCPEWKLRP